MSDIFKQIETMGAQYNALAETLKTLPEEKRGESGGLLLNMIMVRLAMLDMKFDVLAATMIPDVAKSNGPRIVAPDGRGIVR